MRWSITLPSHHVVAGGPEGPGQDAGALTLGPDLDGRRATVSVMCRDEQLVVRARATAEGSAGFRPNHDEWANRAFLAVQLDPMHDHGTRWVYAIDDREQLVASSAYVVQGEEAGDTGSTPLGKPPRAAGRFGYEAGNTFTAELSIPATDVAWGPGRPAGLAVSVGFHEALIPRPLSWPGRPEWAQDTPLIFGDLYPAPPDFRIDEIAMDRPFWGGDASQLHVCGTVSGDGARQGTVGVRIELPGDSEEAQPDVAWRQEDGTLDVRIPVVFPFRAKWANGLLNTARLHLCFRDSGGRTVWQAVYPFGFDGGIIPRERFGASAGEPSPRPDPQAPDFLDAFRSYVLTRIPDYRMQTTREGAPSDFFLDDPTGEASLDLSAADSLDRVAGMLAGRFPDWRDALCAAAMWVHHPLVTRHSSTWSRVSNLASVDSIPRLAGCFCGDTTRLTAALAEGVGRTMGVAIKAYSMGLRGHLATLVDTPEGRVVLDGMLGLWFHTLDNQRLATLEEMRACRQIAERVWYAPRAHGHEFFYDTDDQLIRDWQVGPLKWPEGQA